MFWGNGDTSKLSEDERMTLEHLRRMVETGHIVALTPVQAALAVEALSWYGRWIAVGQFLTAVRNVGLLVGGILALWWATQGQLVDWIRSVVAQ